MMIATRSILRLLLINNKKQTSRHLSQERCLLVCMQYKIKVTSKGYIFIAKGRPSLYLTLSPKRPEYLHEDNSDQIQSEKSY